MKTVIALYLLAIAAFLLGVDLPDHLRAAARHVCAFLAISAYALLVYLSHTSSKP